MRPLYEVKIIDNTKLDIVSVVDKPANQKEAIKLKEQKELKLSFNEDKQLMTGVVLMPNQEIFRRDVNGFEYDIKFSEQTITQLNEIHMNVANQMNTTLDHLTESELNDVVLIENWLVTDPKNDKSNAIGLGELPVGTWMQTKKINNIDLWAKVKEGDYNGFSIELKDFDLQQVELSDEDKLKSIIDILS